jgi:hypothetical protein
VRLRYARYTMTAPREANPWSREALFARPEVLCDDVKVEREESALR